jgi:hypothetical protein
MTKNGLLKQRAQVLGLLLRSAQGGKALRIRELPALVFAVWARSQARPDQGCKELLLCRESFPAGSGAETDRRVRPSSASPRCAASQICSLQRVLLETRGASQSQELIHLPVRLTAVAEKNSAFRAGPRF